MSVKRNIVNEWLDKNGNPEITKQVEQEAKNIMKNIHVLPTDKPSRLVEIIQFNLLFDKTNVYSEQYKLHHKYKNKHIYITSDEKIKEGDNCINLAHSQIVKPTDAEWANSNHHNLKKIILTTDQDLIKDGVQAIDDYLLEWFVKNPSYERVEAGFACRGLFGNTPIGEYKIIIPKEEPKYKGKALSTEEVLANRSNAYEFIDFDKQETLEELKKWKEEALISHEINQKLIEKLMAEKKLMYSEEEVINAIIIAFTNGERYGWESKDTIGNIIEMKQKIQLISLEELIEKFKTNKI